MKKYKQFIFEDYNFNPQTNEANFEYSLDGLVHFSEKITWNVESSKYDEEILDRALFALWIMAGISYYKTHLPNKIMIKKGALNHTQADFFNKTYLLGLAQFFYTNRLDWKGIINFEANSENTQEVKNLDGEGYISAIGGGKDSIVAAEILKKVGIKPKTWAVNQAERFTKLVDAMELEIDSVTRKLDPILMQLNANGAYNGHIPITAINGFIGVVMAILLGKKSIVWAIESSTDENNTLWRDLPVNHQYSKTYQFEKEISKYIRTNIAKDIEYFSILRPFTELRIAEIFCKNYFEKYKALFSSCNANFSFNNQDELKWCGKCPKCAFVFIIFSPFLQKANLLELFGGKDIFADEEMKPVIEELLGISGHKPLECVGEIAETRLAVQMAKQTGQYPELEQFVFPMVDYDYRKWAGSSIPQDLLSKLKQQID